MNPSRFRKLSLITALAMLLVSQMLPVMAAADDAPTSPTPAATSKPTAVVVGRDERAERPAFIALIQNDPLVIAPKRPRQQTISVLSPDGSFHGHVAGDVLRFGDTIQLPPLNRMIGLFTKKILWSPGARSKVRLGKDNWKTNENAYNIFLVSGWLRVVNLGQALDLETPNAKIVMQSGSLWMQSQSQSTEIYLESGTVVTTNGEQIQGKAFLKSGSGGAWSTKYGPWDQLVLENKIAQLTGDWVKFLVEPEKRWHDGDFDEAWDKAMKVYWHGKE